MSYSVFVFPYFLRFCALR